MIAINIIMVVMDQSLHETTGEPLGVTAILFVVRISFENGNVWRRWGPLRSGQGWQGPGVKIRCDSCLNLGLSN
jgi:hypothetical protein